MEKEEAEKYLKLQADIALGQMELLKGNLLSSRLKRNCTND